MSTRTSVRVAVVAVMVICGALPATPADHRDGPIIVGTMWLDAGVTARLIVTAVDLHRAPKPEGADPGRRAQRLIAGFEVYAAEPRADTAAMGLRLLRVEAHELTLAAGEGVVLEFTAPADGAFVRPVVDATSGGPHVLPQIVELRRDGLTFAVIGGMPAAGHR